MYELAVAVRVFEQGGMRITGLLVQLVVEITQAIECGVVEWMDGVTGEGGVGLDVIVESVFTGGLLLGLQEQGRHRLVMEMRAVRQGGVSCLCNR